MAKRNLCSLEPLAIFLISLLIFRTLIERLSPGPETEFLVDEEQIVDTIIYGQMYNIINFYTCIHSLSFDGLR